MKTISGQVVRLPTKKQNGLILTQEGKQKYVPFRFKGSKNPLITIRSFVRLKGHHLQDEQVYIVEDWENISTTLSKSNLETLITRGINATQAELEQYLEKSGYIRLSEIAEIIADPNTDDEKVEKMVKTAEEVFGERSSHLLGRITSINSDVEINKLKSVLEKRELFLDYPQLLTVRDFFIHRASRQGKSVAELIDEDPYLLVRVPALFNNRWQAFHVADKITKHEGKSHFNEKRVNGIIAHLLWEEIEKGHVFMYRSKLFRHAIGRLMNGQKNDGTTYKNASAAVESVVRSNIAGVVPDNSYNKSAVYLTRTFFSEKYSAEQLANIITTPNTDQLDPLKLLEEAKIEAQKFENIELDTSQQECIYSVAENNLTLIKGEAGSGKTSVISALCRAYHNITGKEPAILAPTGIAAQQTANRAGVSEYATIHRYASIESANKDLELSQPEENNQKPDEENMDMPGLIIIEEASMCDIVMLYKMLYKAEKNSRFVFVGDPNQLPPVGPGNIFNILLETVKENNLPNTSVCTLESVYRQKEGNGILKLAREVKHGNEDGITKIMDNPAPEVEFIITDSNEEEEIYKKTIELAKKHYSPANEDVKVITPFRKSDKSKKGILDATILNAELQKQNKNSFIPGTNFKQGDPIIAVRNDYSPSEIIDKNYYEVEDTGHRNTTPVSPRQKIKQSLFKRRAKRPTIFNGTKGTVLRESKRNGERFVIVSYKMPSGNNIEVPYYIEEMGIYVELAYSLTVHKNQGQGTKHVILSLPTELGSFGRDMLYTAITRAERKLTIISTEETLLMLTAAEPTACNSKLKDRLLDQLGLLETSSSSTKNTIPEFKEAGEEW